MEARGQGVTRGQGVSPFVGPIGLARATLRAAYGATSVYKDGARLAARAAAGASATVASTPRRLADGPLAAARRHPHGAGACLRGAAARVRTPSCWLQPIRPRAVPRRAPPRPRRSADGGR